VTIDDVFEIATEVSIERRWRRDRYVALQPGEIHKRDEGVIRGDPNP
jgi:hypothetical protein